MCSQTRNSCVKTFGQSVKEQKFKAKKIEGEGQFDPPPPSRLLGLRPKGGTWSKLFLIWENWMFLEKWLYLGKFGYMLRNWSFGGKTCEINLFMSLMSHESMSQRSIFLFFSLFISLFTFFKIFSTI